MADFLAYEPLEDPLHPPEHLPSPMSVLGWQAGDAFDMSVALCSLLIGVGYNAYVVVGYAPQVSGEGGCRLMWVVIVMGRMDWCE